MTTALGLVRRNLRIYYRDRGQVILSLIAPLILLLLYVLFLGNMQIDALAADLPSASDDDINAFVYTWVFAGMVMITTVTTGLSALNTFVDDRIFGRFKDFRVSPINPIQLVAGYLVASFLIALVMSMVVFVVGLGVVATLYSGFPGWGAVAASIGYTTLMCLGFSALSSLIVTFVRSSGAFTSLSVIVGTIIGFLACAYIPSGTMSKGVVDVLNSLPFSQSAMLLREPLAGGPLDTLTEDLPGARETIADFFGFELHVGAGEATPAIAVLVLVGLTVVCGALGALRMGRSIK
jgi:multidrug/hemolysin transport system permease protein